MVLKNSSGMDKIMCLNDCTYDLKLGRFSRTESFKKDAIYSFSENKEWLNNSGCSLLVYLYMIYDENASRGYCKVSSEFFAENFCSLSNEITEIQNMFEKLMDEK